MNENKQKCLDLINNIVYFKELEVDEKDIVPEKEELSRLILAFHEREVRMELVDRFKAIGSQKQVISMHGLKVLGELLKYMLTAIIHEKDINFKVIHAILNVSQLLYFKEYKHETDA